jgi:hypothetical protein
MDLLSTGMNLCRAKKAFLIAELTEKAQARLSLS